MKINRIITIKRYQFVVGGLVYVRHQPSVQRLGYDNYVKLIVPQRLPDDGVRLKGIGREWFTAGKSKGDPRS